MTEFLLAFALLTLIVGGMALGALRGRPPLKGSCGGLGRVGLEDCEFCGGNPAQCGRDA